MQRLMGGPSRAGAAKMKIFLIAVSILSWSCMPTWADKPEKVNTPLQEDPGSMIPVASFNVHRSVGMDWRCLPNRIVAVVKELNAAVVGLQEVDAYSFGQIEPLVRELGYHVIAGPTMLRRNGRYGNALLTRYEAHSIRMVDLNIPGCEPRGALEVALHIRGKKVRVIVTHLGLGKAERHLQVERLCESIPRDPAEVTVLLGDFNEWAYWGKTIRLLHHNFGQSRTLRTYPSFLPLLALDRVVVQPERALIKARVHATPLSRIASDHLPVKALVCLD
jgi:endonuclease/exonuclease/phosphatase family metal-dependent hydrolase